MRGLVLKRTVTLLLVLLMLLTAAVSCSRTDTSDPSDSSALSTQTNESGSDDVVETTGETEYVVPDVDLGGRTYTILNCTKDTWKMIGYITADEISTDKISNEAFARTLWIQQTLNCKIKEVNVGVDSLETEVEKDVMGGGTNTYDAAYQLANKLLNGIIAGKYTALDTVEAMNLEADYWMRDLMDSATLNGKTYFAASDLQLMAFESSRCIYFNTQYFIDNKIEAPYALVKSGKWTLEELMSLSRQAKDLGNDSSWSFNVEGECVYGFTSFNDCIHALMYGMGMRFTMKDATDMPYMTCSSSDFLVKGSKLSEFLDETGTFYYSKSSGSENGYDRVFMKGRAAMVAVSVRFAAELRTAGMEFGILPFPKTDSDQTQYHTTVPAKLPVLTIPSSNQSPEEIGTILDALSYRANEKMVDLYYRERISLMNNSGDQLNNIDMLEIVKSTRSLDPFISYGIDPDLYNQVIWSMAAGGTDLSSTITKYKGKGEIVLSELRTFLSVQ